ncbi:alpha/beta fold hydrolase [Amaricoccus solimangrovi]|uniref:Alpha/beta fold hydrolase n=1 Tax=Amaricoccus solimangrovi TaxID=2589815 RepID=A0A501WA05_9RHOB|nr:alpha/beta hydrolase [Amaricoccus solimangrovi]TPE46773.1 alpha/beta fold hydrolase [Amaricoccus solimangrovi]
MPLTIPPRSETRSGAAYLAEGAGEPLVLVHGVGLRAEAWAAQIAALSATNRVIALDLPGHGGARPLAPGAELPDFVTWLAAVFDDLGIERASLAGHSMGALIASGMATEHPERLDRVALLCGVHRRSPEARAAVVARAEALRSGHRDTAGPLARWFGTETGDPAYALVRGWLETVDAEGYATAYRAFATGDATYADVWPGFARPALFLTGALDANSTAAMARAMAAAAPRGTAVVIEGHGHMAPMTAPAAVNAALATWLTEEAAR